jgi:Pectate lyase superfamily protein/Major tropism determinant N-terminal domain
MAILQISRIQVRRGLQQDLPQLASGEFGWSLDTRQVFIGNGTIGEGAPTEGTTELLTEHSDLLSFIETYTFKGLASGFTTVTGVDELHPITRTLQDKIDDYVSVKDFGAKGDGVTDDTAAIQRALDRAFAGNEKTLLQNHHRTIYFPAGQYVVSDTIKIPPFSRIQGEGKRTTLIVGSFAGPVVTFKDSFGQTGMNFSAPDIHANNPDNAEFHVSDVSFLQEVDTYDQPCLTIDGCWGAYFNRVMFRGGTEFTTADLGHTDVFDIDRGPGVAAVAINNASNYIACRNIIFNQCDFMNHNYGIEMNEATRGITVTSCFFDFLYRSIVIGENSSTYYPYGVSVFDNYFRYSAAEAIYCGPSTNNIMCESNLFTGAGLADYPAETPIVNPDGIAQTSVIVFNDNNNYSIADSFDRDDTDYALFPNIQTNGFNCYLVAQDQGVVNGHLNTATGYVTSLSTNLSYVSAGLRYIPTAYRNMVINYAVNTGTAERVGSLKLARVGSTISWSDEYTETASTGVAFNANTTTGDIEYTSTGSASLTYNLNYFTE